MHSCSYKEGADTITLTFPRALEGDVKLHGGWRMNPGLTVPSDCMRMPMLSFYGVPVRRASQEG